MTHRFSRLLGAAVLAAMMSLPAAAQEYSNGGNWAAGRGPAILTPVEAFGVHPAGPDPAEAKHWCYRLRQPYVPYYAPLSPVASTARWRPWAYHWLLPFYTPYYIGYGPHRHINPPPRPYGWNGWGAGPMPEEPLPEEPGTTPLSYAGYTSVVEDDTIFWNMGGNGLVPYGAPQPAAGLPDLVDAIQASRPRGRLRRGPAIVPPVEGPNGTSHRRTKPAEPIPPGEASQEQEDDRGPDGSSERTKPAEPSPDGASDSPPLKTEH